MYWHGLVERVFFATADAALTCEKSYGKDRSIDRRMSSCRSCDWFRFYSYKLLVMTSAQLLD